MPPARASWRGSLRSTGFAFSLLSQRALRPPGSAGDHHLIAGSAQSGQARLSGPILRSLSKGSRFPCFLRSPETLLLYSSVSHVAITMRCRSSGVSASSRWASNTRRSSPPFIDTNQAPSANSCPPPGTGATFPRYRRPPWMKSIERSTFTSLATLAQQPRHGEDPSLGASPTDLADWAPCWPGATGRQAASGGKTGRR